MNKAFRLPLHGWIVFALAALTIGVFAQGVNHRFILVDGKMLYPVSLAVYYPHPANAIPGWKVIGAACLLAAVSALRRAWGWEWRSLSAGTSRGPWRSCARRCGSPPATNGPGQSLRRPSSGRGGKDVAAAARRPGEKRPSAIPLARGWLIPERFDQDGVDLGQRQPSFFHKDVAQYPVALPGEVVFDLFDERLQQMFRGNEPALDGHLPESPAIIDAETDVGNLHPPSPPEGRNGAWTASFLSCLSE